jgi:hypothetical protein
MTTRFACRRRTAAEWTALNEVLILGEWGVETDLLPDGVRAKLGDGTTPWNALAYAVNTAATVSAAFAGLTGNPDDNVALAAALDAHRDAAIAAAATDATAKANAAQSAAIAASDPVGAASTAQAAAAADATSKANAAYAAAVAASEPTVAGGSTGQIYRGDKTWANVLFGVFGLVNALGSVDASATLTLTRDMTATGATTRRGVYNAGVASVTDPNTNATYYYTAASTSGAGTVSALTNYYASQGTLDAPVTTQYGFLAGSSLVGASSSNYGFYGNLPANALVNWNFYANGTAPNYMAGALGIGSNALTNIGLRITKNITGSITSYGVYADGQIQSDVTTQAAIFNSTPSTQAAAFTLGTLRHFYANQGATGAGSSITIAHGFEVSSTLAGATNTRGFVGNLAAGSGVFNLYMPGTALNHLNGGLGLGTTSLSAHTIRNTLNISGSTTAFGLLMGNTVQSDVTTSANIVSVNPGTAAASFALTALRYFYAQQSTFGAGSTVANQYGFAADASLTGATNNYGFFGNIAAGTGRWNAHMAGTADNFFNGAVGIGSSTPSATGGANLYITRGITGLTTSYGVRLAATVATDVTTAALGYFSTLTVAGSNPTGLGTCANFNSGSIATSSGTVVTNAYGFRNNWGAISPGANNYGFFTDQSKEPGGTGLSFTARTVTNIDITSNVVTVTTSAAHGFVVGQEISHNVGTNTQIDGVRTIASTPTTTTYTFAQTTADVVSMVDTGTATPTRKWGFYASGTVNNYIAGALLIGTTTTPVDSALLQLTSTTQGFLPPRMTSAQRTAISSPVTGLMVYNTTLVGAEYYSGSTWVQVGTRTPRMQTAAGTGTITVTADTTDQNNLTAISGNVTMAAPTGTPIDGQELFLRFKDAGVAKTITWNAIFRAVGVTLPTTTVANKTHYVYAKYNVADTKWDVLDVKQEA